MSLTDRSSDVCVVRNQNLQPHHTDERIARRKILGADGRVWHAFTTMSDTNPSQRPVTALTCGRDELNLIDFPISTLQFQQPFTKDGKLPDEVVCVVESFDRDVDDIVQRKLTKRTASKHGFPTPVEDEVLVGLLTLTRIKNNFQHPRINFRNGELYELMGWPHNGTSNQRLSIALDRLTGLTLKYENSWTIDDGSFQKEFTTGLLDSYKFIRQTAGSRRSDREQSWIQWASEVFTDIQNGNVKELNTDEFFSLQRPISQRVYRFLDKHLLQSPTFEMDLITFAEHLGISETRHIGKIKERLAPGIAELEALGTFIEPVAREDRYRKRGPGQWLIRFRKALNCRPAGIIENPPQGQSSNDAPSKLVRAFYLAWRGAEPSRISKKELEHAAALIARYGEQPIELLPKVIKAMKLSFPDARVFGASISYFDEIIAKVNKAQAIRQQQIEDSTQLEAEKPRSAVHRKRREQMRERWRGLPDSKRVAIFEAVIEQGDETVRRFIRQGRTSDPLVEIACMNELERQIKEETLQ